MNKTEIMTKATRMFHRTGLKIKKHSPEILLTGGIIGVVASGVMACKATLKVNEIIEPVKRDIDKINESAEHGATPAGISYNEEDRKKDLALVYTQTGVKMAKLYGPSITLATVSIGLIVGSHHMLTKRNIALAAAYASVDRGFKEYRGRVIERFGKELDRELRYNLKTEEIEETVVDEEGNETVVTKPVQVYDPTAYSPYAIVYDDGNLGWEKDAELNKFFLLEKQEYANVMLQTRGHVFLNEVYDLLGAKRTKAGQEVGWVYDDKHPVGDNYIDFGIFDIHNPEKVRFVNGYERSIILDFNVDGVIKDLI